MTGKIPPQLIMDMRFEKTPNPFRIYWYSPEDGKEVRALVRKLDLLIVPYAFLMYWTKYIDQANINNAYVSGMKEDLHLKGNDLIRLQTIYVAGAVIGQIPFLFLLVALPIHWTIPFLDVAWGVFTLLQYRANSYTEIMVYRFMVGWFEAAYFPAMHYTFGCWYKENEIARRGGLWHTAQVVGTATAGWIQAGASAKLDGVCGLAGWRWMYIICATITIPIGVGGYFILPGTPAKPNMIFLNQEDIELASSRLQAAGHNIAEQWSFQTMRSVLKRRRVWSFLALAVLFWNGSINVLSNGFLLWLKSLNRYSYARINAYGSIQPALGVIFIPLVCFASDFFLGPAWAITFGHLWNITGLMILVVWHVPEGAKWFGFLTTYFSISMSAVMYGWVNSSLADSPVGRSFTIVGINIIAQSTVAWTPLLVFKTVEAPRFVKGYSYVIGSATCMLIAAHIIQHNLRRDDKWRQAQESPIGKAEAKRDEIVIQQHAIGTSSTEHSFINV